jgi:hypothetical protein
MDTLTGPTGSGPGPGASVGGDAGTGMAAARTGAASVKFFDKADSTRVSAQLSWQKLEPMAGGAAGAAGVGEAVVQEPRGYVYLRDGSIAAIRAVQGAFFTPKGGREPESGRFEGGVTVEIFDPQVDAQGRERAIDLAKDRPSIIAQTRTLVFNAPEAELSTQDAFTIDSERMSIAGTGALIIFDQVEEGISRGEFVRVDQVRIWPGTATRPDVPTSGVRSRLASRRLGGAGGAGGTGGAGGETRAGSGQERTRLYRLTIEDDVAIRQGPRRLLASRVEGWMTLVNNKLADGAIGQLGPIAPRANPGTSAGTSGGPTSGATVTAAEADGEPIVATWKGRMVLVPTANVPEELRPNLVALRLMGGSNGPVRVIDEPARLAGEASIVDYGATNRTLVMRVPGGGGGGAGGAAGRGGHWGQGRAQRWRGRDAGVHAGAGGLASGQGGGDWRGRTGCGAGGWCAGAVRVVERGADADVCDQGRLAGAAADQRDGAGECAGARGQRTGGGERAGGGDHVWHAGGDGRWERGAAVIGAGDHAER